MPAKGVFARGASAEGERRQRNTRLETIAVVTNGEHVPSWERKPEELFHAEPSPAPGGGTDSPARTNQRGIHSLLKRVESRMFETHGLLGGFGWGQIANV